MAGIGLGGVIEPFLGGEGFETVREVRHPDLAKRTAISYLDWDTERDRSDRMLGAFSRNYRTTLRTALPEEQAAIGRYFSGDMDRILASMRANQAAREAALTDRSLAYRNAALSRSLMGGDAIPTSWLARDASRASYDAYLGDALRTATRERADLDALERARLSLTGRRAELERARLLPYELRQADFSRRLANLGTLGRLDDTAYFTGLKEKENFFNQLADSSAAFWNTAATAGAIAGNFTGSGGGQPPPYDQSTSNWAPTGSSAAMAWQPPPPLTANSYNVNPYVNPPPTPPPSTTWNVSPWASPPRETYSNPFQYSYSY